MKRGELPSLDDLRAFETIARLGSVRAAAEDLALTHGAVSRRASNLSAALGLTLLEPEGRGLRLTREGAKLAATTTQALDLIAGTLREIRAPSAPSPILLSCERSLAMRWLIPRLSGFQDRFPQTEVHLSTGGGSVDFGRNHVNLAIRRLDFALQPDWQVDRLMTERMGPVHLVGHVADLGSGEYTALGSHTRPEAWPNWLRDHPQMPRPRRIRMLDHHFLMVEAALGGLGVAMAPWVLVRDDVARKRLDAPLGFDPDGTDYGLIAPKSGSEPEGLRALRDWLVQQADADLCADP
jgi:DNA-binding transcriptional LysR family regulator